MNPCNKGVTHSIITMLITRLFTRIIKPCSHRCIPYCLVRNNFTDRWKKVKMETDPGLKSRTNPVIEKLQSPEFYSIFTPELDTLAKLFEKYNYEIRIAGGAVRDILMGIQPKDLDFATTATPDEMKEMFTKEEIRMINMKGEKHGTITSRINDTTNFEITTLRIDVVTDGRHAQVEFTKDWKLDANRRDLTINSMFLGLDGTVYDYFYGYDDLKKRRIAFVGNAETRIQEDYLRILRYFRFYGRIADEPDSHDVDTIEAIQRNVNGLGRIAGERIWSEWQKILEGRFAVNLLRKMIDSGLAPYIGLPKKPNVEEFTRVYKRAMENGIKLRPISLISALLEDQEEVMKLHARLKLSAYDRDLALFIVQHRGDKHSVNPLKPYQHLVLIPRGKVHGLKELVCEVLRYSGKVELLEQFTEWQPPRFPVNGEMLKAHVKHGKLIGIVMTKLKEDWLESDFQLSSEELLKRVPHIMGELTDLTK